jgi:thiol reductant ABC exporter CydC subunit
MTVAPAAGGQAAAAPAAAPAVQLTGAQIRRRLLALVRPVLPPLGLSTLFRAAGLVCGIALLGVAGHTVLGLAAPPAPARAPSPAVPAWLIALVALSLAKGLFRYLEQYCGHYVAFRALARLRLYFYDRLAPQAPAAVEGRDTGDLLSRVTKDVDRVEVFFAHTVAPAVTAAVVPAATVVYVGAAVSPWAVAPLAAGLAVVGLVTPVLGRARSARAARQLREGRGAVAGHVRDSVQGVREVLAFDYGDRRLAELDALGRPIGRALRSIGDTVALRRGINVAAMALTLVAELVVLAAAGLPPAVMGLGLGVTVAAFAPVTAVEDFAADLQQAYASARRIFEVTDAVPRVPDSAAGCGTVGSSEIKTIPVPVLISPPEVRFEDVTFRYPGASRSAPALAGVTLTAAAGKVTAVVGASGSGKSTLAALLTRSWDPDGGRITIGGRELADWTLADLRGLVAVAPQRPYLFNQSIRDNLLVARPDATAEDLGRAAERARLDAVTASKEEGWDAPVGELGELLSGGERQRLALARTLLREPAVLVVDEATSQLDAATEAQVVAGLTRAAAGRTVILVAHRLSTVRDADSVYVMDAGRVVQHGAYTELAAQPGPFADLLAREDPDPRPGLAR